MFISSKVLSANIVANLKSMLTFYKYFEIGKRNPKPFDNTINEIINFLFNIDFLKRFAFPLVSLS